MKKVGKMGLRVVVPKQVDRGYVRRRAGAEWFIRDRPLDLLTLIESIKEDFQVSISLEEAKQLFTTHIGDMMCSDRAKLEQEFVMVVRELAIENPEFMRRLKTVSVEQLLNQAEDT